MTQQSGNDRIFLIEKTYVPEIERSFQYPPMRNGTSNRNFGQSGNMPDARREAARRNNFEISLMNLKARQ